MNRPLSPAPCARRFTLIELLVVVSIIAVLASLLLPALSAARQKAKQAACSSLLKQIYTAGAMYGNDYADWVPPMYYTNPGILDSYGWSDATFRCPGKPDEFGYGMNANFGNPIPFMTPQWGGAGNPWFVGHGRIRFFHSTDPSQLVFFMDAKTYYGAYWQNNTFLLQYYSSTRHGDGGANTVFLEGNVEYRKDTWLQRANSSPVSKINPAGYVEGWGGYYFRCR